MQSIRQNIAWLAIPIAGLAGGTAFLLVVLLLSLPWLGVDAALILSYFASLLLGSDVLLDAGTGTLAVGIGVHYVLSIVFAALIALVVHRWGMLVGLVGGTVLGVSLYAINLYTMTLFFPWFFALNSMLLLLAHAVFGAVAGGVYEALDDYDVRRSAEVAR